MKILITEKQFKKLLILLEDLKSQRERYVKQGYDPDIVDRYLSDFKEIKEKKYREAAEADISNLNVPKGNARFDIDQYKTFQELEILVDYVAGQRNVGSVNFEDIEVDGTPIFQNDDIEIYYADTPRACIEYKGNNPYSWCVSRKDNNMFNTYRLKEHEPAFYFVKRKVATNEEFKLWNLKAFVGKFNDKYHFFVLQVLKNANVKDEERKQYIVTSAQNDGDIQMNWNEILTFAPELNGLNNIFQPIPLSKEEREKVEKYQNGLSDEEFIKLPYKEKKYYLDIYVTMTKLLSFEQFKSLPDDLKNHYIGFGVGLFDEQFELIKNNKLLFKRYKQIAERKFLEYSKSDKIRDYFHFSESQLLLIDKLPDDIIEFEKSLDLRNTSIKSLGNLENVVGSLNLRNTQIKSLGNLEEVGKNLNLENTPIKSLGNLETVGGYLDLANTQIQSLGNLKEVGKNLNLENTPIKSLGNLEEVGKNLNLENTPIKSLGNLETVGGYLDLANTQIQSLGNLKEVGKNLNLENTPIKSLGNLETVGWSLFLNYTQITSLDNLEYVGRNLFLENTPLAKTHTIEKLEEMYPQFKGKFII